MSPIIVAIIVSVSALIGYVSYKIAGPDNQVEEACEAVIKIETGATIDLSPNESPHDSTKTEEAKSGVTPESPAK